MRKETWVNKEQLDIPLCEIFDGVKTDGTVREYVRIAETILRLPHLVLESLSYTEMNRYIDRLSEQMDKI